MGPWSLVFRSTVYHISGNIGESKIWCFDAKWIWHYFNLVDCSLQHMKLCTFIILAEFKFGVMDPICQIAKLKSSPKFQRIRYTNRHLETSKYLAQVHLFEVHPLFKCLLLIL